MCFRKIDLEYENGKQLQVTKIKITEAKENIPRPPPTTHLISRSGSGTEPSWINMVKARQLEHINAH